MVLFHTFGSTEDLAVTILINTDGNKYRYVLDLAAPTTFQVHTVNVDIGVIAGKGPTTPFVDVFVGFLIKVTGWYQRILWFPIMPRLYLQHGVQRHRQDTFRSEPLR